MMPNPPDFGSMSPAELQAYVAGNGAAAPAPIAAPSNSPPPGMPDFNNMDVKELKSYASQGKSDVDTAGVIEEMHPDFSAADRLVVKNFSANPDEARKYLASKHPNLELVERDGNFLARQKGTQEAFKTLDPNPNWISNPGAVVEDSIMDVGDVLYDSLAGVLSGAATGAGAVLGGLGTGGLAALPAGAAAGAASSAGLEGVRQGIGGLLGVNQSVSYPDLAAATIGGAAAPFLAGSGSAVKPVLKEGANFATRQLANIADQGLLGMGMDKLVKPAAAWAGSLASGVTEGELGLLYNKAKEFWPKAASPRAAREGFKETARSIDEGFKTKGQKVIKPYIDELTKAEADGSMVNLKAVTEALDNKIEETRALVNRNGNAKDSSENQLLTMLEDLKAGHFTGEGEKTITHAREIPGTLDPITLRPKMSYEEQVVPTRTLLDAKSPMAAQQLEQELNKLSGFARRRPGQVTSDLTDLSPAEREFEYFGKNQLKPKLASEMEGLVGVDARKANKDYGYIADLRDEVQSSIKTPEALFRTTKNADINTNMARQGLLDEVDEALKGTGAQSLRESGTMNRALERYGPGRDSFFSSLKNSRSVPLGLGLGTAGYFFGGEGEGGSKGGAIAGGILGAALGNPIAMQKYVSGLLKVKGGKDKLLEALPFLPPAISQQVMSSWFGIEP